MLVCSASTRTSPRLRRSASREHLPRRRNARGLLRPRRTVLPISRSVPAATSSARGEGAVDAIIAYSGVGGVAQWLNWSGRCRVSRHGIRGARAIGEAIAGQGEYTGNVPPAPSTHAPPMSACVGNCRFMSAPFRMPRGRAAGVPTYRKDVRTAVIRPHRASRSVSRNGWAVFFPATRHVGPPEDRGRDDLDGRRIQSMPLVSLPPKKP